jgi:hypothetical protein
LPQADISVPNPVLDGCGSIGSVVMMAKDFNQ